MTVIILFTIFYLLEICFLFIFIIFTYYILLYFHIYYIINVHTYKHWSLLKGLVTFCPSLNYGFKFRGDPHCLLLFQSG